MTEAPTVPLFICSENACQIATGGACLEGFPDPKGCPHASADLGAADHGPEYSEEEDPQVDGPTEDQATERDEPELKQRGDLVSVPGDEALTLQEVGDLMAKYPVNMVLVAGEAAAGKTTLVAELFARFLAGKLRGWTFGGSETLRAFHIRLHPSLAESGAGKSTTERTAEEDMRFLHLCLFQNGVRHHVLLSDGKGEYFENLINGSTVATEVPIAGRVDRCLIAVDGERLNDPRLRDASLSHLRLLLRALRGPNGVPATCPVAIVCTKWDRVDPGYRESALERLRKVAEAQSGSVVVLTTSVRPGPPKSQIDGLSEVLDFLAPSTHREAAGGEEIESVPSTYAGQGRHFWRKPPSTQEV